MSSPGEGRGKGGRCGFGVDGGQERGAAAEGRPRKSFLPRDPIYLLSLPLPLGFADRRERGRHPCASRLSAGGCERGRPGCPPRRTM